MKPQSNESKELYPVKDVVVSIAGVLIAMVCGVIAANFVTSYAGIGISGL